MTEEENRIVGDFGEYALAYYLTKKGVHVIRVDTVFFDLIMKDPNQEISNIPNKIIGISVKTRDRSNTTPSCTIQIKDYNKIEQFGEKWNIQPWIGIIIISKNNEKNRVLEGFMFNYSKAKDYFSKGKRENAVSISKLRKDVDNYFIKTKNYFKWVL